MTSGMELIRSQRGLSAEIARATGYTRGAIARWQRVPAELVVKIEAVTGIPRETLRPDLYRGAVTPEDFLPREPAAQRDAA